MPFVFSAEFLRSGPERQAHRVADASHHRKGAFHAYGVALLEERLDRFVQLRVFAFGGVEIARLGVVHAAHEAFGENVGHHRDHPVAAAAHQGNGDAVVARQHEEALGTVVEDALHLFDVARSLLDADDVLEVAGDAQRGFGGHVDARAPGDVVEDHRQGRMFRHGAEMLVQPLLRRLVVIGRHAEYGIGAAQVEFAQLVQHLRRGVSAAAHHQRHAAGDVVGDEHGDHGAFGHIEGRGFGRGAQGDDVVHAAFDHVVDHAGQRLVIHAAVRREGGYHRGAHAGKFVS